LAGVALVGIVLVASWYIAERMVNGTPRPVADTLFVLIAAGTLIALAGSIIAKRRRHAAPTLTRSPAVSPSPRAVPATSRAADRTVGSAITALSISPRDGIAVVAAKDVSIVELDRLGVVKVLPPHGVIRAIAWSPDGARFATGRGVLWTEGQAEAGDSIFLWDAATGQPIRRIRGEGFGVRGLAFSPNGRHLIASSMHGPAAADGSSVDLFDADTGERVARLGHFVATQRRFTAVAYTPDGAHALAGTDRGIRLWRVSDGAEVDVAPVDAWITALSVTSDGARVFVAGGVLSMRTFPTNAAVWHIASARDHVAAASPDGRWVARGVGEQVDNHGPYEGIAIEIYDGASGALVSSGFHPTTIEAIVFSPSGRSVLSGGVAGELVWWTI
jgi:WD40 repeat protein